LLPQCELHLTRSKPLRFTYDLEDDIATKSHKITTRVYRGKGIVLSEKTKKSL
jgi:formyltetrahydrofolate synthetase